jgi:hypothetical protein
MPGVFNRPGLSAIRYRAGTYAAFRDAMIRRLTVPVKAGENGAAYSLHALTTREPDDPAIALLDAWAVTADVLTFYQERIANESYLRTATERRSVIELGRLVGYTMKPGVAASAYLAYTVDDGAKTTIPAGSKAQSIPGADEQPQMFETSEDIEARGDWNALRPRMSRPQRITIDQTGKGVDRNGNPSLVLVDNVLTIESVWIKGTNTIFAKRDPLLFVFEGSILGNAVYAIRRVLRAEPDTDLDRTRLVLEPLRPYYTRLYLAALIHLNDAGVNPIGDAAPAEVAVTPGKSSSKKAKARAAAALAVATADEQPSVVQMLLREILLGATRTVLLRRFINSGLPAPVADPLGQNDLLDEVSPPVAGTFASLFNPLIAARALAPRDQFQFKRLLADTFAVRSDADLRLLAAFRPELRSTLYTALANVSAGDKPHAQFRGLFVLRRQASVFGYNAADVQFQDGAKPIPSLVIEAKNILYLDTPDEKITTGSYAVIRKALETRVATILEAESVSRSAYGISGKSTGLTLDTPWADDVVSTDNPGKLRANLVEIRETSLYVESEELTLSQRPIDRPVGAPGDPADPAGESPSRIEVDPVFDGLTPGRWVIVRGERLIEGTSGVVAAELAMVASVEQQTNVDAGGTPFSILVLAPDGLAYQYKRSTVQILANVVPATNGETHAEILGSGAAAKPMQTFALHQAPLTFVAAPTVDGIRSTLAVRVDDALWHETDSLAYAAPDDRVYTTKAADDGTVSVTFGDGIHGQRLFSGNDNVRATYRSGIGRGGNVRAGQIATAISRPLHLKDVVNPNEATGGADPESADDARKNIPVSLQAMGRVVSVSDFADFARTFAGIAKATAKLMSAGGTRLVHLTIAGTGDIHIDEHSDLYRNLVESLRKFGDPFQPFVVGVRRRIVITGAARVRVGADFLWSLVAPKIRAALIDTFSYDRREFGQPVFAAEVVAAMQNVPGVEYVDLDALMGVREKDVLPAFAATLAPGPAIENPLMTPSTNPPASASHCAKEPVIAPDFAKPDKDVAANELGLSKQFLSAEIAYLPPELADLFILTEIKP